MTLSDLRGPLTALHALAAEYPLLPAADVHVSPIYPNHLEIHCHDSFAKFEAWREALKADPGKVERREQGSATVHLKAAAEFAGITVALHGYGPLIHTAHMAKAVA